MENKEYTRVIEHWADYQAGRLSDRDHDWLEKYLASHPDIQLELEEQQTIWDRLDTLEYPDPSGAMDERFYSWVDEKVSDTHPMRHRPMWIVGIAASIAGFLVSFFLFFNKSDTTELSELTAEVASLKEIMVLSLIEQPDAYDRIRAVNMSEHMDQPNTKILEILHHTLTTDPNINVRLAALESLMEYWRVPEVRTLIIQSISDQKSPIVQSAIADAMLEARAKESAPALKSLLDDPNTHDLVKEKLNMTINKLQSI